MEYCEAIFRDDNNETWECCKKKNHKGNHASYVCEYDECHWIEERTEY